MNKRSLLATPYIIWIIGFTVLPILMIVFYALGDGNGGFTLANILAIFQPVHLKSLLLALWLALLCTAICLVLAYPLAVMLRKLNIGKQGMMAIIVILPMWVNFVLRIMAWQLLLSRNGIINALLGALGLPGQHLANSNVAIVIGMVYDYLPFMILPVYNAVSELNEDILEAARDLGAPPKAVLTKIMIPLTMPGIISGITMVFVPSLTTFAIPDILGGGKIMLIGNIIELESWFWFIHCADDLCVDQYDVYFKNRCRKGAQRMVKRFFMKFYLVLIIAFLYIPIAVLVVLSFNASRSRVVWGGFTLEWYQNLLHNSDVMAALQNTLTIGFASAAIATGIGLLAAIGIDAMRKRSYTLTLGVGNIPMLNADIVTGIALMLWFSRFTNLGYVSILLAHITFNIPYVILSILPKLQQMDMSVYEAARDLGANSVTAFVRVILPMIFPSVMSGFFMALTMSMDDFVVTYFTKGAGINTLSTMIYGELKRGIKPEMYALSTLIFVVVLVILLLANYVPRIHQNRVNAGRKATAFMSR